MSRIISISISISVALFLWCVVALSYFNFALAEDVTGMGDTGIGTESMYSGGGMGDTGIGTESMYSGGGVNQPATGGVNQPATGGAGSNVSPSISNSPPSLQNPGPPGKLLNPLKSQTISEFLLKIIDVLLIFALPIIILFIMYAGYLFVTSAGNPEKISTARTALLWAVVGGVIVLGAKVIIGVIQGTITAF